MFSFRILSTLLKDRERKRKKNQYSVFFTSFCQKKPNNYILKIRGPIYLDHLLTFPLPFESVARTFLLTEVRVEWEVTFCFWFL